MDRRALLRHLASLVGTNVFVLEAEQAGWPGLATIVTGAGPVKVAIHVGLVGSSQRGRDDVERRFQNPGKDRPMSCPPDRLPLLIGVWEEAGAPVLVAADPVRRLGRITRFSVFIGLAALHSAARLGWAEHYSTDGERVVAFHPGLLPVFVMQRVLGVDVDAQELLGALAASGLTEPEAPGALQRARVVSFSIVRRHSFARDVVRAYNGLCAMCGINFELIEGAHIYPASAPGSEDVVSNGLALCCNHHRAFDRHRIWIEPETYRLRVHKDLATAPNEDSRRFAELTLPELLLPGDPGAHPSSDMLARRYQHFTDLYTWARPR